MSNCCSGNNPQRMQVQQRTGGIIRSWFDIEEMQPRDIRDLIAYAELAGSAGTFKFSSTFLDSTWGASPFAIASAPTVATTHTDNLALVEEAKQWNMQHKTWNGDPSTPIPLLTKIFLRSGIENINTIPLDFSPDTVTNLQISFLLNGGTRGDAQGTIGVIEWDSISLADTQNLKLTLKYTGQYCIGLRATMSGGASMFPLELNSVA